MAKIYLALLFFFTSAWGMAQSSSTSLVPQFSKISIAPSFGLMFTDLSISGAGSTVRTTPGLGYSIGADVYVPSRNPYFDYLTGLYFSYAKTRVETVGGTDRFTEVTDSTVEMRRLSVPLIVRIHPFKRGGFFYTRVGAINNFLLSAQQETESRVYQKFSLTGRVNATNYIEDLALEQGYKTYSLDGLAGVGFQVNLFKVQAFVEVNYLYGLTPVASGTNEIRSSGYYGTFGLGF